MNVKCITIEGENAIVAAADFDWLCTQARRAEKLERVLKAALDVIAWDWSDNDDEPVADITRLFDACKAV